MCEPCLQNNDDTINTISFAPNQNLDDKQDSNKNRKKAISCNQPIEKHLKISGVEICENEI